MKKNLLLLAASYFCGVTVFFANTTVMNIIAKRIAHEGNLESSLATFPFGFLVTFTALVLAPAGMAMNKFGCKKVFIFAAFLGCAGSLVCLGGLLSESVAALCLFTLGVALQGCAYGVVNYYRHVAVLMGGSDDGFKSWCVAIVISSGALGGIVGPGLTSIAQAVFPLNSYMVIYITITVVYVLQVFLLSFVQFTGDQISTSASNPPRPLFCVIKQTKYIYACINGTVSNGLMMMIMGVTPILLSDHLSLIYLSVIVQLHAVSMFVPSFLTSKLIGKYGPLPLIGAGYFLGAAGAAVYLIDDGDIWHIYACRIISLILIGIAWNFTFLSSTTLLANCYKPNEKYKAQSFNDTCLFGLGGILSILCGTFLKLFGLLYIIVCSIVIYSLIAALNTVYIIRQNGKAVLAGDAEKIIAANNEVQLQTLLVKPHNEDNLD